MTVDLIDVRDLVEHPGTSRRVHLHEPVAFRTELADLLEPIDGDLLLEGVDRRLEDRRNRAEPALASEEAPDGNIIGRNQRTCGTYPGAPCCQGGGKSGEPPKIRGLEGEGAARRQVDRWDQALHALRIPEGVSDWPPHVGARELGNGRPIAERHESVHRALRMYEDPDTLQSRADEGDFVAAIPGVEPFPCRVGP